MKPYTFIFLATLVISCDGLLLGDEDQVIGLEENLKTPPALHDDWEVSTLAAQNINAEPIQNLIRSLQKDPQNIHSLVIVRNNKLVAESYFDGWHRDRLHATRSASKSFISTFVGIAIDKGHISDVHQKVFDYFPEYAHLNNAQKSQIEIRQLLTMTSGLQWDEKSYPSSDSRNDETAFEKSNDRLGYILGKEVVNKPGDRFEYNSGCPVVEAAIIEKSTGEDAEIFAKKNFFAPLNITNYYWRKNDDGLITAVGPILLRPRDMAKLGQLFLDSGKWKGQQIVSAKWVADATVTVKGNETNATGYGYHWWTAQYTINSKPIRIFFAQGSGGQYIFVVPGLNAVLVFTSGNYEPLNQRAPFGMMTNVILPAMF
jgi:CubicO group peptidase (beta-lactamase class C family)